MISTRWPGEPEAFKVTEVSISPIGIEAQMEHVIGYVYPTKPKGPPVNKAAFRRFIARRSGAAHYEQKVRRPCP